MVRFHQLMNWAERKSKWSLGNSCHQTTRLFPYLIISCRTAFTIKNKNFGYRRALDNLKKRRIERLKEESRMFDVDLLRSYNNAPYLSPQLAFGNAIHQKEGVEWEQHLLDLISKNQYEGAEFLYKQRIGTPTPRLFNAMLICCANNPGKETNLEGLLNDMISFNVKPDLKTYKSIIETYLRQDNTDMAIKLVRQLQDGAKELDLPLHNAIIAKLGSRGVRPMMEHLKLMKVVGANPNAETYFHIISWLGQYGIIHEMMKHLKQMMKRKVRPTPEIFKVMTEILQKNELHDELKQLHQIKSNLKINT
jgi:hypothetical protein